MGRGKPFVGDLNRLISAGVVPRPAWMSCVEATRPRFQPVTVTRPPRIEYPEDRLRNNFLQRNPDARRIPVNMKAKSIPERHIADKFVSIQTELMEQKGMSEEEAYNAAEQVLSETGNWDQQLGGDMYGSLSDPAVSDEATRLYLASLRDSKRDAALHRVLVQQTKESN